MNLTCTCLSRFSLISSLPFRLPGGFFPFQNPIREAHPSLWTLFLSMSMLGVGCGPQVGPFPSQPIMGSIRGEGTPPQTLAVIWKKKEVISLSSGCSRKVGKGVQLPLLLLPPPHDSAPPPPRRWPPLLAPAVDSSPLSSRRRRPRLRLPPLPPLDRRAAIPSTSISISVHTLHVPLPELPSMNLSVVLPIDPPPPMSPRISPIFCSPPLLANPSSSPGSPSPISLTLSTGQEFASQPSRSYPLPRSFPTSFRVNVLSWKSTSPPDSLPFSVPVSSIATHLCSATTLPSPDFFPLAHFNREIESQVPHLAASLRIPIRQP